MKILNVYDELKIKWIYHINTVNAKYISLKS